MMARRVGITGFFGAGNMGDDAILHAMLAQLRQRGSFDFTVFGVDQRAVARDHGVAAFPLSFRPGRGSLRRMRELDAMILGGGGLLHDYWRAGPLRYAAWGLACRLLGTPMYVHAMGIGPLDARSSRFWSAALLRRARDVTVRDEQSLALARALGASARICPDPAITLDAPSAAQVEAYLSETGLEREGYVVVAPRRWFHLGERPDPERMERLALALAHACDHLCARGLRPVLLPMHRGRDEAVCSRLQDLMEHPGGAFMHPACSLQQALCLIGGAAAVLAMRLHALLFAGLCGVPVAAVAYDPKVGNLMSAAGQVRLDAATCRGEDAAAALDRALSDGGLRAGFAETMSRWREQAAREYDRLAESLGAGAPAEVQP